MMYFIFCPEKGIFVSFLAYFSTVLTQVALECL